MRSFGVVENDMLMGSVWSWAQDAGFTALEFDVFHALPFVVTPARYADFLRGGRTADEFATVVRHGQAHRAFVLAKGEPDKPDSRTAAGLRGLIEVHGFPASRRRGEALEFRIRAINAGSSTWLPSDFDLGAVRVGVIWRGLTGASGGQHEDRVRLSGHAVLSGQTVDASVTLDGRSLPGDYEVTINLVAEGVSWFDVLGTPSVVCLVHID